MGIYEATKDVANVLREAGKIEEYKTILDLQGKLQEMQNTIFELEKENRNLKEKFEIKEKLVYRNNSYWNEEDGPFCSRCFEKNKNLLRMHYGVGDNYAHCPECKASINFTGREEEFSGTYYED